MTEQPNILLITTDHWPAALLGCADHPVIQTPTLDQLAASGVRYTNAYSECPVCIPARRTLMTGVSPRTHGDRVFLETLPMPNLPTLAATFTAAGYQTYAVGKLHVYPQRDRIGFDDVILDEEGRLQYGTIDDYELYLGDTGYAGCQYEHGMSNNEYSTRAWHLPEETHATNWATRSMCRTIQRRDPTRPAFWYLSYRHPHPPLVPLRSYLQLYQDMGLEIDDPFLGGWAQNRDRLPFSLQAHVTRGDKYDEAQTRMARLAFYALCTHIDHQLRVVVGTLREEGLLSNTVICFTSDHGEMLGNHHMWAKRLFYESSANVPMLLLGPEGEPRIRTGTVDDRLVGLQDVMPTLLDLAGVAIPESVEGRSMVASDSGREWLYGEIDEGDHATRMIRKGKHKLIYYAAGNHRQLFDLELDPEELLDLSSSPEHRELLDEMTLHLIESLYGEDRQWVEGSKLKGLPNRNFQPGPNRGLTSQRGAHWPPPPESDLPQIQWFSEAD